MKRMEADEIILFISYVLKTENAELVYEMRDLLNFF